MGNLNRKFNKQGIILVENNGYDGDLELSNADFIIKGVGISDGKINIDILFEANQEGHPQLHQRTISMPLDGIEPGVMTGIINQYNSIINKILLKLPEFLDATEITE